MLRAENLSKKVYDHLKAEIYAGRFPTRHGLFETQIAEGLGVSRTPVREAIRMLENEGLLEPLAAGGFRAHEITTRDVQDAFAMRTSIEATIVQLAAQRIGEDQGRELDRILDRAREAVRAGLLDEVMQHNERFHTYLAECTGSRLTGQLLARVYDYIKTHRLLQRLAAKGDVREIQESIDREHREIAEAVKAHDARLAMDRMHRHLEGVSVLYQKSLEPTPERGAELRGFEEEHA